MNYSTHLESDVVLIVDDVPENLALLCDSLDEAGYDVLVATDGVSAIERVGLVIPDAILLDAVMPGIDGFDTCRRIKAEKGCATVPVLFMTALTQTESIVKGFAAGGVDYVTKPIDPDEVIARVGAHIRNSRAISEARRAIDGAGQAMVVFGPAAGLVWASKRAREIFGIEGAAQTDTSSLDRVALWASQFIAGRAPEGSEAVLMGFESPAGPVTARYVGAVGKGRFLCVLDPESAPGADALGERFSLTPREMEVLAWIASGKTDRDIADILGIRPRTVNKHLEHIYVKLGVETRTAAAALAQPLRNRMLV